MKILVFSDIHGDYRALERLMDIEADYYFAAGDLVSWGRGLDRCGEILQRRGETGSTSCPAITNPRIELTAALCEKVRLALFSRAELRGRRLPHRGPGLLNSHAVPTRRASTPRRRWPSAWPDSPA